MVRSKHPKLWHKMLLAAGPIVGTVAAFSIPGQISNAETALSVTLVMRITIGLAAWMALWWMTEVVPMAVTALFPLLIFTLCGVRPPMAVVLAYLHPLIFLFLGGFLLSIAVQKWSLHVRFAMYVIRAFGSSPRRLIGGFMFATAALSMWISNTATTIMMLPIALSVLGVQGRTSDFPRCLLLSIAYAASIGGMASIIGTPPNTFVASYLHETQGLDVGFASWMALGLPCSACFLLVSWVFLTRVRFKLDSVPEQNGANVLLDADMEPLGAAQWRTLTVFFLVAFLWMFRPVVTTIEVLGSQPLLWLSDAWIAMLGAFVLFVLPSGGPPRTRLLSAADLRRVPWGTLILFGGGLALASTISATGVDQLLGMVISRFPIQTSAIWLAAIIAMVVLLTEITSNIATTATLVPVLAASAAFFGLEQTTVVVATALAASCAFMLPVATPPNAIVYGSGEVSARDMATTGFSLNLIGIVLVTLLMTQWFKGFAT